MPDGARVSPAPQPQPVSPRPRPARPPPRTGSLQLCPQPGAAPHNRPHCPMHRGGRRRRHYWGQLGTLGIPHLEQRGDRGQPGEYDTHPSPLPKSHGLGRGGAGPGTSQQTRQTPEGTRVGSRWPMMDPDREATDQDGQGRSRRDRAQGAGRAVRAGAGGRPESAGSRQGRPRPLTYS